MSRLVDNLDLGVQRLKISNGPILGRVKWVEKERRAGVYGKKIVGLVRQFRAEEFRVVNGLGFGTWVGRVYSLASRRDIPCIRELDVATKTKAAQERVTGYPKDFLTQMFDGFEFLGHIGVDAVLLLAHVGAAEHGELARFVQVYEKLAVTPIEVTENDVLRDENGEVKWGNGRPGDMYLRMPTLEEAAREAGLGYGKLIGLLSEVSVDYGHNMSRIVIHTSTPSVIKKIVKDATDPETANIKAQELALKAAGLIESGGGKIQINNNQISAPVPVAHGTQTSDMGRGSTFNRGHLTEICDCIVTGKQIGRAHV